MIYNHAGGFEDDDQSFYFFDALQHDALRTAVRGAIGQSEDKQWDCEPTGSDEIWWRGLADGTDPAMVNHLRFTQDLIRLRWAQPAIRGDNLRVFHVHNANRVIASTCMTIG